MSDRTGKICPLEAVKLVTLTGRHRHARLTEQVRYAFRNRPAPLSKHPAWLDILHTSLGHDVYMIEATQHNHIVGLLPLAHVSSLLFGQFLVSLPYLNSNGVMAESESVAEALVTRAVTLADELHVKHLELRQEAEIPHSALTQSLRSKIHMRLTLPTTAEALWKAIDTKVRNQIRKGEKASFRYEWGGESLIEPFYAVLAENMRDLGTPVFAKSLFATILKQFPNDAELIVAFDGTTPVAGALLLHGPGVTEVPTASSLRRVNASCVNMVMYHRLLLRAIERQQALFDFGRSSVDGTTYRFKKQWGATPSPAVWQYATRAANISEMRPDNPKYQRLIRVWQNLPVSVTRWLGPHIVRGIP